MLPSLLLYLLFQMPVGTVTSHLLTNSAAFSPGQYSSATTGDAANTYSSLTFDTRGVRGDVNLTVQFGSASNLSGTAFVWIEFIENSETPVTSGSPTAIEYSSGRVTLPAGYSRHASATSTEVFRATSSITVLNKAYTFRVATSGQRYLGARMYRPAGSGIVVPFAGTWSWNTL